MSCLKEALIPFRNVLTFSTTLIEVVWACTDDKLVADTGDQSAPFTLFKAINILGPTDPVVSTCVEPRLSGGGEGRGVHVVGLLQIQILGQVWIVGSTQSFCSSMTHQLLLNLQTCQRAHLELEDTFS